MTLGGDWAQPLMGASSCAYDVSFMVKESGGDLELPKNWLWGPYSVPRIESLVWPENAIALGR